MARLLLGKPIAETVIDTVRAGAGSLQETFGLEIGLAVIIVGDDPASHTYVKAKSEMAMRCGFRSTQYNLRVETSREELLDLVVRLNGDDGVHGLLVQLPLPKHLEPEEIIQSIAPEKDVDGLHVVNAGKVATGDFTTGLVSCTPAGAMMLVRHARGDDLSGLNAVVIGRSNLFGKPMAQLLLHANATVTIAHSRSNNLPTLCRSADILVAAVGRPELVRGDWVKPGATVIDVGINRVPAPDIGEGKTRLVGDVAFNEADKVAGVITPVPGGVGPMTIAMLMANTLKCAEQSLARKTILQPVQPPQVVTSDG